MTQLLQITNRFRVQPEAQGTLALGGKFMALAHLRMISREGRGIGPELLCKVSRRGILRASLGFCVYGPMLLAGAIFVWAFVHILQTHEGVGHLPALGSWRSRSISEPHPPVEVTREDGLRATRTAVAHGAWR